MKLLEYLLIDCADKIMPWVFGAVMALAVATACCQIAKVVM